MAHIDEYLAEYGEKSFCDEPFNEVDNLIFSQLIYTDFAQIVDGMDSDREVLLKTAAEVYFNLHSEEQIDNFIAIEKKSNYLLRDCAKTKRFASCKLLYYVDNVNTKIDKQFSAISFLLDDDSMLIAFRGTDTTLTGVKESAMLSYMFPVPAQIEALYYLQECAGSTYKAIRVCGHSKGGNLAVYAAVSCSNSLKKRIVAVYENDAPGFPKEMLTRYDYVAIKDKIYSFIPEGSIIGCLLEHNEQSKIVKSDNEGLKQHQVSSWQVDGNKFLYVDKRNDESLFVEKYIKQLMNDAGAENMETMFEAIFDFFENSGITDYDKLKNIDFANFIKAIMSVKGINEEERHLIENTAKLAISDLTSLFYKEKIKSVIKKFDLSELIPVKEDKSKPIIEVDADSINKIE